MQGKTDNCPQRLSLFIIGLAWLGGTLATAALALGDFAKLYISSYHSLD